MYLTEEEIPLYTSLVSGVTMDIVNFVSTVIINSYIGGSLLPTQHTQTVKLLNNKGKLKHTPIISIDEVKARRVTPFGFTDETMSVDSLFLEEDGYFAYYDTGLNSMIYGSKPSHLTIKYNAGYNIIPEDIKNVCAALAMAVVQKKSFAGEKSLSSLDMRVEFSSDSFLTSDMKMALNKYRNLY